MTKMKRIAPKVSSMQRSEPQPESMGDTIVPPEPSARVTRTWRLASMPDESLRVAQEA